MKCIYISKFYMLVLESFISVIITNHSTISKYILHRTYTWVISEKKDKAKIFSNFRLKKKGGMALIEVNNLDQKRVCDISNDQRFVEIRKKDCLTRIAANPDGTLTITQERIAHVA